MNHTLNYEKKKKKERLADKFLLHNYCVAITSICIFSNKYDESVIVSRTKYYFLQITFHVMKLTISTL